METFQCKLIVFRYMGPNAPSKFTRKEHRILMRGMLPEIPIDAIEFDIREEILSVIKTNTEIDLSECDKFDLEFLDASGKNVNVLNLKPGCTVNCRTFKRLAGNGAEYIRLCKDFEGSDEDPVKTRTPTRAPDTPVESPDMPTYMEYLQSSLPEFHVPPETSLYSEMPVVTSSQTLIDLTRETPALPQTSSSLVPPQTPTSLVPPQTPPLVISHQTPSLVVPP